MSELIYKGAPILGLPGGTNESYDDTELRNKIKLLREDLDLYTESNNQSVNNLYASLYVDTELSNSFYLTDLNEYIELKHISRYMCFHNIANTTLKLQIFEELKVTNGPVTLKQGAILGNIDTFGLYNNVGAGPYFL